MYFFVKLLLPTAVLDYGNTIVHILLFDAEFFPKKKILFAQHSVCMFYFFDEMKRGINVINRTDQGHLFLRQ